MLFKSISFTALDRDNQVYTELEVNFFMTRAYRKQLALDSSEKKWFYDNIDLSCRALRIISLLEDLEEDAMAEESLLEALFYQINEDLADQLHYEYIKHDYVKRD